MGITQSEAERADDSVSFRYRRTAHDGDNESRQHNSPGAPKRKANSPIDAPCNKRVCQGRLSTPPLESNITGHACELGTKEKAHIGPRPDRPDQAPDGEKSLNIPPCGPSDANISIMASNTSHTNEPNPLSLTKEDGSITVTAPKDAASDNEDSVQGLDLPGAGAVRYCNDNEHDRQRLASELLPVLSGKLQQPPDKSALSSTLELLESIFNLATVFTGNLEHAKDSFKQWLGCLRAVLKFYEDTNFTGNLKTRKAFKMTLPTSLARSMTQIYLQHRASLSKLRHERKIDNNDFAKEVASVLFQLASWDNDMELQEMEFITSQFTKALLAWFE